jgi:NAD(P)-dependent dehydrogenase (short-subunit alcohol dehydrogenase family)
VSADVEVIEAGPLGGVGDLEPALLAAFRRARAALAAGRPVVAVVRDGDLLGHGEPADAALANAVLGLVRTLAVEGVREGWTVNALAVGEGVSEQQRATWTRRLGEGEAAGGALLRLGELHLGRVPV